MSSRFLMSVVSAEIEVKHGFRAGAPGSHSRILTYLKGKTVWQGEEVEPKDPIPGLD